MQVKQLIEDLSSELKLEVIPQKDKKGFYQLKVGSSPQVSIKELDSGMFFEARILPIPKEGNKEALFIYLMRANFLGQGTGGAAIGIDPSEKFFILTLTLPFEINYRTFHERLEDYLNYIDYWKEEVTTFIKKGFMQ
ncbi:MAG: type III secretion system chaperone [Candidatus Neptunochlamydia sp.]|nr:type III secretion system chaperone [Candidatus Neptunochlamydia sp.]